MTELEIIVGGIAALVIIGLSIGIASLAADDTETVAPPRAAGLKQDQHTLIRSDRIRRLQQRAERERIAFWNEE